LVTTVRPGTPASRWASAYVVVPAETATAIPGSASATAASAIASFSLLLECRLRREAGFEQGVTGDRGRPAVDLLEETALMEDLQVAADGHVGDTEIADEVGHAHGSVLPDTVKDEGLALSRKHQATLTEPSLRIALDPLRSCVDPTEIAAQPTESQRIQTMRNKNRSKFLTWRVRIRTIRLVLLDFVGSTRGGRGRSERLPNRTEQIGAGPVMA